MTVTLLSEIVDTHQEDEEDEKDKKDEKLMWTWTMCCWRICLVITRWSKKKMSMSMIPFAIMVVVVEDAVYLVKYLDIVN